MPLRKVNSAILTSANNSMNSERRLALKSNMTRKTSDKERPKIYTVTASMFFILELNFFDQTK
jgi:hypothetical protein